MNTFKLRVDIGTHDTQPLFDFFNRYFTRYCYCYEGGEENPHIHLYLETDRSMSAIRQQLINMNYVGNGKYSLKKATKDPVEYVSYMMKERRFFAHTLDPVLVANAQAHQMKVLAEMKAKKDGKLPVWRQILNSHHCRAPGCSHTESCSHPECIQQTIVYYTIEHKLSVRKYGLDGYYDTLVCYLQYENNHGDISRFMEMFSHQ